MNSTQILNKIIKLEKSRRKRPKRMWKKNIMPTLWYVHWKEREFRIDGEISELFHEHLLENI